MANNLAIWQRSPEVVFPQTSALRTKLGIAKKQKQTDIVNIKVNKVTPLDIRLEQDKEVCCTSGMGVTSKGILVSDENNKSVKLFSRDNKFLSCLNFSVRLKNASVIDD